MLKPPNARAFKEKALLHIPGQQRKLPEVNAQLTVPVLAQTQQASGRAVSGILPRKTLI
jgi:hypothetical protein